MEAGRDIDGLAPSSYEATLFFNLADGYPIGVFIPLGVGQALTGLDAAWLVQPYMALLAVLLALASLGAERPHSRECAGAGLRGRPRRSAGAALRVLPLGRDQGGSRGCLDRAGRVPAFRAAPAGAGVRMLWPAAFAIAALISCLSVAGGGMGRAAPFRRPRRGGAGRLPCAGRGEGGRPGRDGRPDDRARPGRGRARSAHLVAARRSRGAREPHRGAFGAPGPRHLARRRLPGRRRRDVRHDRALRLRARRGGCRARRGAPGAALGSRRLPRGRPSGRAGDRAGRLAMGPGQGVRDRLAGHALRRLPGMRVGLERAAADPRSRGGRPARRRAWSGRTRSRTAR